MMKKTPYLFYLERVSIPTDEGRAGRAGFFIKAG